MRAQGVILDATRPYEIRAACPVRTCRRVLSLPEDWQRIMLEGMDPVAAMAWDGLMWCKGYPRPHEPAVMVLTAQVNTHFEPDGTVIIHLADNRDRRLAACTGQPYAINHDQIPMGTKLRQCQACFNLYLRGGYKDDP